MTGTSTLDPDNLPLGGQQINGRGHGTGALGPSDTSDSGSDVQGAGAAVGDADLDSDSDAGGTGERGAVGRDDAGDAADIGYDRIDGVAVEEADIGVDGIDGVAAEDSEDDAVEDKDAAAARAK